MITDTVTRMWGNDWTVTQIADSTGLTRHAVRRIIADNEPSHELPDPLPPLFEVFESDHRYIDFDNRFTGNDEFAGVGLARVFNAFTPAKRRHP